MNLLTSSILQLSAVRSLFRRYSLAAQLLALSILALPGRASAHASGWPSQGCSGCHQGGKIPTVTITSDVTPINPGQLVNLTLSISASNGHGAGFYIESTSGKLSVVDSGTKLLGNGVTQNARRTGTGSVTTFKVGWTAPATPGGVDFSAWGNSVNSDGSSFGDAAGEAFLSVAFGCAGTKFYHDFDGDGVGAVSSGYTMACSVPLYYSPRGDDCNDAAPANFPGNPEICDGLDNDCNGQADETLTISTYCTDADGDGHGVAGQATMTGCAPKKGFAVCDKDCNDGDVAIFVGHPEVCDGKDNNCDGQLDELLPITTYCQDADNDGHGVLGGATVMACAKPAGYGACDSDCNDNDPAVYPTAIEICDNKDNNCNNQFDENALLYCGVGWCRRAASGCNSICTPGEPRAEACNDFDDDCDGVADNGTDLQLCGKPGLHCAAGYCVAVPGGDAGAGGEGDASDDAGAAGEGGAAMIDEPSASAGVSNAGGGSAGSDSVGGAPSGLPSTQESTPSTPAASCGLGRASTRSPWLALGWWLGLGCLWRRVRRRRSAEG
jgi:hypothetical protein